jgi:hypothetical protein
MIRGAVSVSRQSMRVTDAAVNSVHRPEQDGCFYQ